MNITVKVTKETPFCPFKLGSLLHVEKIFMISSEFTGDQIVLKATDAEEESPPLGRITPTENVKILRGDIGDIMHFSLLNAYSKIQCL